MSFPMVVSQKTVDEFNAPAKEAALEAQRRNPVAILPRPSGTVKSEFLRRKLSLDSIVGLRDKCRSRLDTAKAQLPRAEERLKELREAGVSDRESNIQKLTGYNYFSKNYQTSQHVPGLIEQLRGVIDTESVRLAELEAAVRREELRLRPELERLETEFNEAVRLETLSAGRSVDTRPPRSLVRE